MVAEDGFVTSVKAASEITGFETMRWKQMRNSTETHTFSGHLMPIYDKDKFILSNIDFLN